MPPRRARVPARGALFHAFSLKRHVATDNGIQFRFPPRQLSDGPHHHASVRDALSENGMAHRFTRINHPWTNGQGERMNRTIEDAPVKLHHDDSHDQLRRRLQDFVSAHDFGRRLKPLKGLSCLAPYALDPRSIKTQN